MVFFSPILVASLHLDNRSFNDSRTLNELSLNRNKTIENKKVSFEIFGCLYFNDRDNNLDLIVAQKNIVQDLGES